VAIYLRPHIGPRRPFNDPKPAAAEGIRADGRARFQRVAAPAAGSKSRPWTRPAGAGWSAATQSATAGPVEQASCFRLLASGLPLGSRGSHLWLSMPAAVQVGNYRVQKNESPSRERLLNFPEA
jgi:hypothetical protein